MSSAQVALLAGSKKTSLPPPMAGPALGPAGFMGPGMRPPGKLPGLGMGPNPMMPHPGGMGGPRPFLPPGPMGMRPPGAGGDPAQYNAMLQQWYSKMAASQQAAPAPAPAAAAAAAVSQEDYYKQWQDYYQALAAYNQATAAAKGPGKKAT